MVYRLWGNLFSFPTKSGGDWPFMSLHPFFLRNCVYEMSRSRWDFRRDSRIFININHAKLDKNVNSCTIPYAKRPMQIEASNKVTLITLSQQWTINKFIPDQWTQKMLWLGSKMFFILNFLRGNKIRMKKRKIWMNQTHTLAVVQRFHSLQVCRLHMGCKDVNVTFMSYFCRSEPYVNGVWGGIVLCEFFSNNGLPTL